MSQPTQRLSICNVPVDHVMVDQLIESFVEWSHPKAPARHVCYVNAHVHNLARRDEALRSVLHDSALCYADGASIVWASRLLGGKLPGRMTGADFLPELVRRLVANQRRIYFLGGKPGVAETTAETLASEIPGFKSAGVSHGFFDDADSGEVIEAINAARPDLLVVGMGTPRQEKWIVKHRASLNVPLVWAVGALLDYNAGEERRCPQWMGEHGLEWLHRLAMKPRRRARRYIWGNVSFVCSVFLSRCRGELVI